MGEEALTIAQQQQSEAPQRHVVDAEALVLERQMEAESTLVQAVDEARISAAEAHEDAQERKDESGPSQELDLLLTSATGHFHDQKQLEDKASQAYQDALDAVHGAKQELQECKHRLEQHKAAAWLERSPAEDEAVSAEREAADLDAELATAAEEPVHEDVLAPSGDVAPEEDPFKEIPDDETVDTREPDEFSVAVEEPEEIPVESPANLEKLQQLAAERRAREEERDRKRNHALQKRKEVEDKIREHDEKSIELTQEIASTEARVKNLEDVADERKAALEAAQASTQVASDEMKSLEEQQKSAPKVAAPLELLVREELDILSGLVKVHTDEEERVLRDAKAAAAAWDEERRTLSVTLHNASVQVSVAKDAVQATKDLRQSVTTSAP